MLYGLHASSCRTFINLHCVIDEQSHQVVVCHICNHFNALSLRSPLYSKRCMHNTSKLRFISVVELYPFRSGATVEKTILAGSSRHSTWLMRCSSLARTRTSLCCFMFHKMIFPFEHPRTSISPDSSKSAAVIRTICSVISMNYKSNITT